MNKDNEHEPKVPASISSPTSKVTIAFPFSQIKTQEPSDELRELARIVVELADQVARLRPSPDLDQLAEQSRALFTKLGR